MGKEEKAESRSGQRKYGLTAICRWVGEFGLECGGFLLREKGGKWVLVGYYRQTYYGRPSGHPSVCSQRSERHQNQNSFSMDSFVWRKLSFSPGIEKGKITVREKQIQVTGSEKTKSERWECGNGVKIRESVWEMYRDEKESFYWFTTKIVNLLTAIC